VDLGVHPESYLPYHVEWLSKGDPLSPLIFVLMMEFWSISMDLSVLTTKLKPIEEGYEDVTYLFADDVLVFCKADKSSVKGLNDILQKLQLNTCLEINKQKSKVFFSEGMQEQG